MALKHDLFFFLVFTPHLFRSSGISPQGILVFFPPTGRGCSPRRAPCRNLNISIWRWILWETQTTKKFYRGNSHEKLLLWLMSLDSNSLWSQKLQEALTHRCLPGCLPIWPSRGLATMPHYKSREQIEGYWVGQGVGILSAMLLYQFSTSLQN